MLKIFKLPVIITVDEEGYYVAEIPVLPGCYSQGKSKEEALARIKEAAKLCLSCKDEEGWDVPEYSIEYIKIGVECQKSQESQVKNALLPLKNSDIE